MSTKGGARGVVLITALIGTALLFSGGIAIWRLLPANALADAGRVPGEYTAPAAIPVVLPETNLAGVRLAILEEPENAILSEPGRYREEVERWRRWLEEAGAEFVPAEAADALILPLADCLGNEARVLIERHLRKGGGLVTSGVLGSRSGDCRPAADTVLTQLLGSSVPSPALARPDRARRHVVLLGETMLSAGIPAGARIDLDPRSQVIFRGPQREAFFATYERQPEPVDGEAFFDGAVARSVAGSGRVMAFGFEISDVLDGWSERVARLMMGNAVRWAAGGPVVQLATWPGEHRAAAVVAQDVEADYGNAAGAIRLLKAAEIPTTYFIVGSLARSHAWITRDMARSGELASHSYSHLPMDGFSDQGLYEELVLSKQSAEEYAGRAIRGFRPPEERFTIETLRAWAELGGDYFFAHDHGRTAAPVFVPFGADSLVFMGRVVYDDFEILSRHGMRDRGEMVRTLTRQMDEVVGFRGAYMFTYHSHILAQEQLLPVLSEVVNGLKARPEIWLTTAGEVARWWRTRAAIDIVVADDGLSAELRNLGHATYSEGAVLIDLPSGERRRVSVPDLRGGQAVRVRWD